MTTAHSESSVAAPAKASRKARFRIRWVLAHEPAAIFEPAAREFARLVALRTDGELRVDILSLSDYAPGRGLRIGDMRSELLSGRLEMAQVYAQDLGCLHRPMWVVDAPFLFRSHEHAARVLDGKIGRGLLASLSPHGLRALAFTYSGGYRILAASSREIRRWEDLRGLRVRTTPSPVARMTMEALGAKAVPGTTGQAIALAREGGIDAAETTYARWWDERQYEVQPVICETGHSLLLTAVVLNEKFFSALPREHRAAVVETARVVAVQEREHSLKVGEKAREGALAKGLTIIALDAAERRRFEVAANAAYGRIEPLVGKDVVDAIRATP